MGAFNSRENVMTTLSQRSIVEYVCIYISLLNQLLVVIRRRSKGLGDLNKN